MVTTASVLTLNGVLIEDSLTVILVQALELLHNNLATKGPST